MQETADLHNQQILISLLQQTLLVIWRREYSQRVSDSDIKDKSG